MAITTSALINHTILNISVTPANPYWHSWGVSVDKVRHPDNWDGRGLYLKGCPDPQHPDDEDLRDCTAACQVPARLWNDSLTLHNCMMYPAIVQLHKRENLNVTIGNTKALEKLNISPNTSLPVFQNWTLIDECIKEYCATEGIDCNPAGNNKHVRLKSDTGREFNAFDLGFNADICDNLNAEINPDIGGIGMFVSYIVQIAIVFTAWISWHLVQHWTYYILLLPFMFARQGDQAQDWAAKKRDRLRESTFKGALIRALSDFQKAQVFFMLSVQIACLIAVKNPNYLESESWQQYWNNVGILFDLAFGGCLPILLVLIILRQAGEKDTYMLCISTASVVTAAATWFTTFNLLWIDPEPHIIREIKSTGPEICGGIAPTQYCYSQNWFFSNSTASKTGMAMLIFVLIVQLVLVLDQVRLFVVSKGIIKDTKVWSMCRRLGKEYDNWARGEKRRSWLSRFKLDDAKGLVKGVTGFIELATEITLVLLTIVILRDYGRLLMPRDYIVLNLDKWTLGQVIAVTIWVPILIEFLWNFQADLRKKAHEKHALQNIHHTGNDDKTYEPCTSSDDGRDDADSNESGVALGSLRHDRDSQEHT